MTRTTIRGAGAMALALVAVVLVAAPAQAAAYRYWTYWQAPATATAWAFATQGPGTSVPADGSVEGWSFGVSTQSANLDDAPSITADFAAICGATGAEPGRKRVALVVDTGPAALAPSGQAPPAPITTCVVTDPDDTGYDILRSVAEVRVEGGLVCGVAGYPTDECAPVLADAEAAALLASAAAASAPTTTMPTTAPSVAAMPGGGDRGSAQDGGSPLATIAVAVLLLVGAGFGAWRYRRTR
jgi:hypothetical protein